MFVLSELIGLCFRKSYGRIPSIAQTKAGCILCSQVLRDAVGCKKVHGCGPWLQEVLWVRCRMRSGTNRTRIGELQKCSAFSFTLLHFFLFDYQSPGVVGAKSMSVPRKRGFEIYKPERIFRKWLCACLNWACARCVDAPQPHET